MQTEKPIAQSQGGRTSIEVEWESETYGPDEIWYLGIDFGTTGVSAVLLNGKSGDRYPLYWATNTLSGSKESSYRLPSAVYSGPAQINLGKSPMASVAVGSLASLLASKKPGVFIEKFKPYFKVGIPYYSPRTNNWEPLLQWSEQQPVSLYWLGRSLIALLSTFTPANTLSNSAVRTGANRLDAEKLSKALGNLSGVILGTPMDWSDTYRFNLREAVLGARLVSRPEQIFFLEDAIAILLGVLADNKQSKSKIRGGTIVINAGATATETALVDLPENLQDLNHSNFLRSSFSYGGTAIDQDIICQMLLEGKTDSSSSVLPFTSSVFPASGEPDLENRYRFTCELQSSPLGQALVEAAAYLKRILQHQNEFTLMLGDRQLSCTRADLEKRIILPFVHRLNLSLNALLSQTAISSQAISQVICSGGTSAIGQVRELLRQKFPNANLIIDEFQPSKVAYGLASLPLVPQVLERSQQQYSDYFLLLELLRVFSETPRNSRYEAGEIIQLLERRGLNTRTCLSRLIAILDGQLPPGLIPSSPEKSLLTEEGRENLDYQTIAAEPLFYKEGDRLYRPNQLQCRRLLTFFSIVLSGTHQKLDDPLIIDWGIPAENLLA